MKSFFEWMRQINDGRPDITSDFYGKKGAEKLSVKEEELKISSVQFHGIVLTICAEYTRRTLETKNEIFLDTKNALERIGMTSSKTYKDMIDLSEKEEAANVLRLFKNKFPDSIFMGLDDFKSLCVKYGLVCGHIKEFTGKIYDANIREIDKAMNICVKEGANVINSDYLAIESVRTNMDDDERVIRIKDYIKNFHFAHKEYLRNYEPKYLVWDYRSDSHISVYSHNLRETDMLIAAPGHEMSEIRIEYQIINTPKTLVEDDPIVFQLLPHKIVMIHSKWGEEAGLIEEGRL